MSLIVCAQDCAHQSEGYCELNRITSLSGSRDAKCGYYEKAGKKTLAPENLTEDTQGIRQVD